MSIDGLYKTWASGSAKGAPLDPFIALRVLKACARTRDAVAFREVMSYRSSESMDFLVDFILTGTEPWLVGMLASRSAEADRVDELLAAMSDEDFETAYRACPRGVASGSGRTKAAWARKIPSIRYDILSDTYMPAKSHITWLRKEWVAGRVPASTMATLMGKSRSLSTTLTADLPDDLALRALVLTNATGYERERAATGALKALERALAQPGWAMSSDASHVVEIIRSLVNGRRENRDQVAGTDLGEVLVRAHTDLLEATGTSGLAHFIEEDTPLTAEGVAGLLANGVLAPSALESVVSDLTDSPWWRSVSSHPSLAPRQATRILLALRSYVGDADKEQRNLLGEILTGRDATWLEDVAGSLWQSRDYDPSSWGTDLLSSSDPLAVVLTKVGKDSSLGLFRTWFRSRDDLERGLKSLSWKVPQEVVLEAPVSWGSSDAVAARFLTECRHQLGEDEARWDALEELAPGFEGSFGELLALATTLHRD